MLQISVVIPLLNEEESLPELCDWIVRVMQQHQFTYEIILIDDGSTDQSWNVVQAIAHQHPQQIRGIKFRRNYGKAAALHAGFAAAQGDVVITMDADLQDSPDEIPALYNMITQDGYELVSGWKQQRHDPLNKTLPSKFFNALTRYMSGLPLHDFNCGLKAYHHEVVKNIQVYGELHRYIPVIAKWSGFTRIGEKVVAHQARKYGHSKFGFGRIKGMLDLISITFVGRFGKKPMHFFGVLGTLSFALGFIILCYLSICKLFLNYGGIATRPLFFLGIVTLLAGIQLFLTGFLAELFVRTAATHTVHYLVERRLNNNDPAVADN